MEGVARIVSRDVNNNGIGKVHLLIPWKGEEDLFVVQDYYKVEAKDFGYGDDYVILSTYYNYIRTLKYLPQIAIKADGRGTVLRYVPNKEDFNELLSYSSMSGPTFKKALELLSVASTRSTEEDGKPSWSTSPLPPYLDREASLKMLKQLISVVLKEELGGKPSFNAFGWSFFVRGSRYAYLSDIEDYHSYSHLFEKEGESKDYKMVPLEVFSERRWFAKNRERISRLSLSAFDEDEIFRETDKVSTEISNNLLDMYLLLRVSGAVSLDLKPCLSSQKYVGKSRGRVEALAQIEVSIGVGTKILGDKGIDLVAIPSFSVALTDEEAEKIILGEVEDLPSFILERLYLLVHILPVIALGPEQLEKAISKVGISLKAKQDDPGLPFLLLYERALCQEGVRDSGGRFAWLENWRKLYEEAREELPNLSLREDSVFTRTAFGSPLAEMEFLLVNKEHPEAKDLHIWRVSGGIRARSIEEDLGEVKDEFFGEVVLSQPISGRTLAFLTMEYPLDSVKKEIRGAEAFKNLEEFRKAVYEPFQGVGLSDRAARETKRMIEEEISLPLQRQFSSPLLNPICIPLEPGRKEGLDSLMMRNGVFDHEIFMDLVERKMSSVARAMSGKVDFEFYSVYPFHFIGLWELLLQEEGEGTSLYSKVAKSVSRRNPKLFKEISESAQLLIDRIISGEVGVVFDSALFLEIREEGGEALFYQSSQGFFLKLWENESWALLAYSKPEG